VELCGPAATDVHHNFVQRWNEASERNFADGSWPEGMPVSDLSFPASLSPAAGDIPAQISRTVRRETYRSTTAAFGAASFPLAQGEQSCLEQYLAAVDSARETIYIEDQVLMSLPILEKLENALDRGVELIYILPGKAWGQVMQSSTAPRLRPLFDKLKGLGRFPHFTMAALAANRGPGTYLDVYVHAKIAIVDGLWATIGSCNIADRSFYSDTELNVSFWHEPTAQTFRNDLFQEHLGMDVSPMTDRQAMALFKRTARENTMRRVRGQALQGLVFELDPAHYPSADPWLPDVDPSP
jgi:phosphatidylserine/phosphatidylglycerophosphate/cardiolipin synthase-like enzyme